jgi:shikimate kinase
MTGVVKAVPDRWPSCILLVGLSGSGKSTVGKELADRIGYRFVDLDSEIEAVAGQSVPEIFQALGESGFRRLEAEATEAIRGRRGLVVATGGGWMARQDIETAWSDSVRVWLCVRPETAARRLDRRLETRPLLEPGAPEASLGRLLDARRAAYSDAECEVDTEGRSAPEVVDEVLKQLRGYRLTGNAEGTNKVGERA